MKHLLPQNLLSEYGYHCQEKKRLEKEMVVTKYQRNDGSTLSYEYDGEIHTWIMTIQGITVWNDTIEDVNVLKELLEKYN